MSTPSESSELQAVKRPEFPKELVVTLERKVQGGKAYYYLHVCTRPRKLSGVVGLYQLVKVGKVKSLETVVKVELE